MSLLLYLLYVLHLLWLHAFYTLFFSSRFRLFEPVFAPACGPHFTRQHIRSHRQVRVLRLHAAVLQFHREA